MDFMDFTFWWFEHLRITDTTFWLWTKLATLEWFWSSLTFWKVMPKWDAVNKTWTHAWSAKRYPVIRPTMPSVKLEN